MNNELAQLAAEVAQLRQQVEESNRRLDMIYGAINRLAEVKPGQPASTPAQPQPLAEEGRPAAVKSGPQPAADLSLSAQMLMGPDTMLASLHQYALKAGLTLAPNGVEHLKSELDGAESHEAE